MLQESYSLYKKVGIVKFHEALDSDHRGLFCDIDKELFTNKSRENNINTGQIGTNSTNKERFKYINHINDQFNHHRIHEKVQKLYNKVMSGQTIDDKHSYVGIEQN
jgi:hypothetical protein